jgi:hypothetical protein
MTKSRDKLKHYFFPIYWIWALIIPITLILLNAYLYSTAGETFGDSMSNFFDEIAWNRALSIFALFGLIYPITIVVFPAFYLGFSDSHGFTFSEAIKFLGDPIYGEIALKIVISVIIFTIVFIGPIVHLIIAAYYHKKHVQTKQDEPLSVINYLYGFI